jgi:peptidyl-prolyl cis-trans isomerase A (cyclophilin A)
MLRYRLLKIAVLTVFAFAAVPCPAQPVVETPAETKVAPEADAVPGAKAEPATGDRAEPGPTPAQRSVLLDPKSSEMSAAAPDSFLVRFETTEGDIVIEVDRSLSPLGADRFHNLVRHGFYDGVRFFRVIEGFMAQFGINGDPAISQAWIDAGIKDEPVRATNARGTLTFAKRGTPDSRTTQIFINFADNTFLDKQGFSPFGKVVEGMDVVDALHAGYGEGAPRGKGPDQGRIQNEGNAYLAGGFEELDYIERATVVAE